MALCIGSGLVVLDVILNGNPDTLPKISAGGSCGNVLSILGFLGWESYPFSRAGDDLASQYLIEDMKRWGVHTDLVNFSSRSPTPIIIHRILKDREGKPMHRFEFRDPVTKSWLPQFRPVTKLMANEVLHRNLVPTVFYFDRINSGTYDLAVALKKKGAILFFEPSSYKEDGLFEKFLHITDILKFSGERLPDFKLRFPEVTCNLEIETLGKDGIQYRSTDTTSCNWTRIAGFKLENLRDTAGAGDWCSAGIIHSLLNDSNNGTPHFSRQKIERSLIFGQSLGALNCLYDGARGLMYYYNSLEIKTLSAKLIETNVLRQTELNLAPTIDTSSNVSFQDLSNSPTRPI